MNVAVHSIPSKIDLIFASLLFMGLQGLDVLTTTIGLAAGAVETNPLMANVLNLHGEPTMYLTKILLELGVVAVVWKLDARYNGKLRMALWLGCVIMAATVGNNFGILNAVGVF
jgi:hypothetical protein